MGPLVQVGHGKMPRGQGLAWSRGRLCLVGAQPVKHPTLHFGSGHNLRAVRWCPTAGSVLSTEFVWNSPSPSAPLLPHSHVCTRTLQKKTNKNRIQEAIGVQLFKEVYFLGYDFPEAALHCAPQLRGVHVCSTMSRMVFVKQHSPSGDLFEIPRKHLPAVFYISA